MAVAFRSASAASSGSGAASAVVSTPGGVVNGDLLLAFVVVSGDNTISAAPSGYTLLTDGNQATGTASGDCRHYVYWRIASSEPATRTWTFANTNDYAAAIVAYTGPHASTPVNASAFTKMSSSTTAHTAPSVTPTATDVFLVRAYGVNPVYDGDLTFTTPSGLTARVEADPGSPTTNRAVLKVFDSAQADAVPSGDKSTTINDSGKGVAFTVAIAPSAGTIFQIATVGPTRTSTGCMHGWWAAGGWGAHEDDEETLGKNFAVVRLYHAYDDWGDTPYLKDDVYDAVDAGRLVMSSHKPPKTPNSWKAIAKGDWDTWIGNLADAYADLDEEIIFVFHHEPHDNASDIKGRDPVGGSTSDYRQAWKRIYDIFADTPGTSKVKMGYCAVGSWAMKGDPKGSGDKCYPGNFIDVICHDVYNWYDYKGGNWESFASEWDDIVDWAGRHDKPIIAGEVGCHPSKDGHSRDDWFRDMADWLKSGTVTKNGRTTAVNKFFIGFCYFHSPPPKNDWTFLDSTVSTSDRMTREHLDNNYPAGTDKGDPNPNYRDGLDGWRDAFVDDAYFKGTPVDMGPPGQTAGGVVALNLVGGGGISSAEKFGKPTITLVGGPRVIEGAGGIGPGEPDVVEFDEDTGAGVDPGGWESNFSISSPYVITGAGGIASAEAFGTPYRTLPASSFTPPVVYELPPILGHFRSAPRGRSVLKFADGTYQTVAADTLTAELEASAVTVYRGGRLYQVSTDEATALARAGYTLGERPAGAVRTWGEVSGLSWGAASGYQWWTL